MTLTPSQKHLLNLTRNGKAEDGWTPISATVFPVMKDLPADLITVEASIIGGGRAILTKRGEAILDWS